MIDIISIILPLVLIILAGFVSAKASWLSLVVQQKLTNIVFLWLIPCFLFINMATANLPTHINSNYFLSFYLPVFFCYGIAWLFYRIKNSSEQSSQSTQIQASASIFALTSSYSNTVIVGLPILYLLKGNDAVVLIFLIVTFHSAMLLTLTGVLASQQSNLLRSFMKAVMNPLILSILLGALLNVLQVPLPDELVFTLKTLSKPSIYLSLFLLGCSLSHYQLSSSKQTIVLSSFIKLLLLPLTVWIFASQIFELTSLETTVLVVLSACPTGINAYLLAMQYQCQQTVAASSVLLSTLISLFSLSFWLFWLQ